MKQPNNSPYHIGKQIIVIYGGINNFLKEVPVDQVVRWEQELVKFIDINASEVLEEIVQKKKIDDDLEAKIKEVLTSFTDVFQVEEV